jgi:Tol biopolymer transport system component/DNA-binding winged helix-turn-helix (wHTH) protein
MSSPARPPDHSAPSDGPLIRFDRYQVDVHSGELRKEGRKIRLQAQPFQLLVLLLRNEGRVVSREDVRLELWPGDTFVDFDHGLALAINKIRNALCDSAENPKFIETLPRRGYRFIGRLEPEPPAEIRPMLQGASAPQPQPEATALAERTAVGMGHRSRLWAIGAALVLLAAGFASAVVLLLNQKRPAPPAEQWNVTQFTSYTGATNAPAFSPDGSRIAFGLDPKDSDESQLYVKALGGEALLQLTHRSAGWISAAWSPDGTQIAFMRLAGPDTGLYVVPALGGPEQKLLATHTPEDLAAPINWSPDGKWIAYADQPEPTSGHRVFLFSLDTRESHLFYHDPACNHEGNLTFSNDGKKVAWVCVRRLDAIDIMVGDPAGRTRRLVTTVGLIPSGLAWSPDDTRLITPQQGAIYSELFEINLSDGSMKRTPAAAGQLHANWPAVSAKTGAMAWNAWRYHIDLLRADLKDLKKPPEPLLKSSRNESHARYSPDGKHIAFSSDRSGTWDVWIGDADGTNLTQIERGRDSGTPQWSPDSRRITYGALEGDVHAIYVVDIDERVPHRLLTATDDAGGPIYSHDGRWIYFQGEGSFLRKFWRCSLDCNKNETLVRDGPKAFSFQESEDGKYWYYVRPEEILKVFRETMKDGHLEDDQEVAGMPPVADASAFAVVKDGIYFAPKQFPKALWYFDFATRQSKQLLKTEQLMTFGFTVSSDGRYALLSQWGDYHQDIMLAEPKR